MNQNTTLEDRAIAFWNKCETRTDGCVVWTGNKDISGYGQTSYRGRPMKAHRLSWVLRFGDIPKGKMVLHSCDVRECVWHLFIGDAKLNAEDCVKKGRNIKGEKSGRAKLTDEEVADIRKSHRPRMGASLARKYGVSEHAIYCIVRRKTWKHL